MGTSMRALCREMDPAYDGGPTSLALLARRHDLAGGAARLAEVARRHDPTRSTVLKFLSYNTFLLRMSIDLPFGIDVLQLTKPEVPERATEIGAMLSREGYDIACLYELFQNSEIDGVTGGMRPTALGIVSGGWASSLLTLGITRRIVEHDFHAFKWKGKTYKVNGVELSADSDFYARKGVLFCKVDTGLRSAAGPIYLEVFSTHLMWGGGSPGVIADAINALTFGDDISESTPQERANIQALQLDELVAFFQRKHDPANVAILSGDFNIDGSSPAAYEPLRARMERIGLVDAWLDGRYAAATGTGQTNRNEDGRGAQESDFGNVCVPMTGPDGQDWCNEHEETRSPSPDVGRLDFLFVERPTGAHRATLAFTRVHRRRFARARRPDGQAFLSDHLGLETRLLISLR